MQALAAPLTFITRRAFHALLVVLAIAAIAFAVRAALGDPLREIMGEAVPQAERAALRQELGLSGVIMESNVGGRIPLDRVLNSIRLFGQEVAPKLRALS